LLLYKILEELNLAYLEQIKLQGSVKSISSKIYLIDYKGINLLMNHDYLLKEVTIGSTIEFKIIDFSWTAAISISTIEVTDSGLLKKLRTDNLFQGTISKVFKNGLLIMINEYYTGYMSNTEISDNWLLDSEPLKEGSKINLSIMKFDYKGLALSRINFKKNKKKSNASSFYKVGDIIEMKIYDKMIFSGLLVKDGTVKGLIPIDKIIPEEVIKEINLLYFIKFCQNLFKKHSFIKCVVCNVEGENNKLLFDIDYEDDRNKSNIIKIIDYFSNDRNLKKIVVDYLNSRLK
jgi:ribosomal protein S1